MPYRAFATTQRLPFELVESALGLLHSALASSSDASRAMVLQSATQLRESAVLLSTTARFEADQHRVFVAAIVSLDERLEKFARLLPATA